MQTDKIKKECYLKNISVSKMLKDLELSPNVLNKWENGVDAKISSLIKISDYLECSIDYLIGKSEQREKGINVNNNHNNSVGTNTVNISIKLDELPYITLAILEELKTIPEDEQADIFKELKNKKNRLD